MLGETVTSVLGGESVTYLDIVESHSQCQARASPTGSHPMGGRTPA